MLDLFTRLSNQNSIEVRYSEFDYIKRSYLRELANIDDYYHNRVYAVKSNHFLASILNHISVPMHYETAQYVNVASTRAPYLANTMKMTSELSPGQFFEGVFYGPGCKELIISDSDYFNPYYAEHNWERISAVKVLLHPRTDLGLLLPNGRASGSDTGLAVISVNIPLLALQYRCFTLGQSVKQSNEGGSLGLSHFIHMYVLPNMLYSHADLVVMNRLMRLYYGEPMGEAYLKHPFPVHNYANKIDNVLKKTVKTLESRNMKFDWMLKNIPCIVNNSMQESLLLPEIPPTRQVLWAMILTRLSIVKFLLDIGKKNSWSNNRSEINAFQRTLKRLKHDSIFNSILPDEINYDVQLIVEEIASY